MLMKNALRTFGGLLLGAGIAACADQNFTATLDPIRVTARGGETVNRQFLLTPGQDQKQMQFRARAEDWWRSEDGSQSFFAKPGTLDSSCAEWVSLNPVEATVKPGEQLKIRVSIAVPASVTPGGHWCVLTVDQLPDPLDQRSGVEIRFLASVSVGIFVYIEPVARNARIVDVRIDGEHARISLQNEGNCPLGVEGRLEFLPAEGGQPVAVALFNRQTVLTEPVRKAWITAKLPDTSRLRNGQYLVRAILDIGLDHYIGVQKRLELRR